MALITLSGGQLVSINSLKCLLGLLITGISAFLLAGLSKRAKLVELRMVWLDLDVKKELESTVGNCAISMVLLLRQRNLVVRHTPRGKHLLSAAPDAANRSLTYSLSSAFPSSLAHSARSLLRPFSPERNLFYPTRDVFVGVPSTSPAHSTSSHRDVNVNIKMSRWIYHVISSSFLGGKLQRDAPRVSIS